jgi:dGTPase
LTWETLEGTAKHNGPLVGPGLERPVPPWIAEYDRRHPLDLDSFPGPEAQIAALSDDIAYNNHDIDDGLRAGLFAVADLVDVPLVGPVFAEVAQANPGLDDARLIRESIRRVIDHMVRDLVGETRRRLAETGVKGADDIRRLGRPVAAFSEEMRNHDRALKRFLFERMYRHYRVNRMSSKARRVVRELFQLFLAEPECLPGEWRALAGGGAAERARLVADYLAGMTDRFALDEHRRLFDTYASV